MRINRNTGSTSANSTRLWPRLAVARMSRSYRHVGVAAEGLWIDDAASRYLLMDRVIAGPLQELDRCRESGRRPGVLRVVLLRVREVRDRAELPGDQDVLGVDLRVGRPGSGFGHRQ